MNCRVADCDRPVRYVGYCGMHYKRLWRHGDPTKVIRARAKAEASKLWKGDDVSNAGVHRRLERYRGKARTLTCVDCGRPADGWSYDHSDPNEQFDSREKNSPYSLDLDHYDPRCFTCHRNFDLGRVA
jgi:choline dehydrogenase-like flavoprotein